MTTKFGNLKIISLTNNVSNFTNADYGWIGFLKWYRYVKLCKLCGMGTPKTLNYSIGTMERKFDW